MEFVDKLMTFISIGYILSVNMATYVMILIIDSAQPRKLATIWKRLLTVLAGVIMWFVYSYFKLITVEVAIPSFFLSVLVYDYLIKSILAKFNITNSKDTSTKPTDETN